MRKLFIEDEGLDKLIDKVNKYHTENNTGIYADKIAVKNYIIDELNRAKTLRGVDIISIPKSGNLRVRTTDLFISDSETGKLRKFFVGKWIIEFTTDNRIKFYSQNKSELGFHSHIWGDNTVHPHISGVNNRGCLGNSEAGLQSYWQAGSLVGAITIAIMYLESVNLNDSAGVYLGYCKEVEIDDAGNPKHNEEGNYIFIKNEFDRAYDNYDTSKRVYECQKGHLDKENGEYLTAAMKYCDVCGEAHNRWNISSAGSIYVCKKCSSNIKKCEVCGTVLLSGKNADSKLINSEHPLCNTCAREHTYSCGLCGKLEVILDSKVEHMERKNIRERSAILTSNKVSNLCTSCIDKLKDREDLRDKTIAKFDKVDTSEELIKIINSLNKREYVLPLSYKSEYIEDIFARPYNIRTDGSIYDNLEYSDIHQFLSYYAQFITDMNLKGKSNIVNIYDEYTPVSMIRLKDRIKVYRSSFRDYTATFIHKSRLLKPFKDFYIMDNGEIVEIEYTETEFNNEDMMQSIVAIPTSVAYQRAICKRDIPLDNLDYISNLVLDAETLCNIIIDEDIICPICKEKIDTVAGCPTLKNGDAIHILCSDITGTKCEHCGNVIKVSQLARNKMFPVDNEKANWCMDCVNRETTEVECSSCGDIIHIADANEYDGEYYCDDCYDNMF